MARVWVSPDRKWEEFGSIRFQVETEIVRPESMHKDDIDIDTDIHSVAWGFPTIEKARAWAQRVINRDDLAFGAVYIQEQIVDWFVEEDRIAEWQDVGDHEEITK